MILITYTFVALCIELVCQGHVVDGHGTHGHNTPDYSELCKQLSTDAAVILKNDPEMANASERWNAYSRPTYAAVVEVATEQDIQTTIVFANQYSVPFLAVDGAHGFLTTLGRMHNGIAISLRKMKSLELSEKGDFAYMDPGLTSGEVVRKLYSKNKVAVTGKCLCTGITGIMLGGGYGYLQGQYGRLTDQILEVNAVLADGTAMTASPNTNKELFWALRGAGHNFGIVTKIKYKIYDKGSDWSQIDMIFTGDQAEAVFDIINKHLVSEEDHPPELVHWVSYIVIPTVDPKKPIILSNLIYQGPLTELEKYASLFQQLQPIRVTKTTNMSFLDVYKVNHDDESSPAACQKSLYRHLAPVLLKSYNLAAQRKVYDIFANLTAFHPEISTWTRVSMEGYSMQAVTKVPRESTSTPFRDYSFLVSPMMGYADASISDDVVRATKEIRKALVDASDDKKLRAYLNYGFGDETVPQVYGYEEWRQMKLTGLKKIYDPKGRFTFYGPFI